MGGGSTKKFFSGADFVEKAVRGTAAVSTLGASEIAIRTAKGKSIIGKDIKNLGKVPSPKVPGVEDIPERDALREASLKNALIDRIRRQAIRGGGIKDTIKTSPRGVINRLPVNIKRLTGA